MPRSIWIQRKGLVIMLIYLIARIVPMAVYFKYCRLAGGRKRSIAGFIVGYLLSVTVAMLVVSRLAYVSDYGRPLDFAVAMLIFLAGLILGETCYLLSWIRWGRGWWRIKFS